MINLYSGFKVDGTIPKRGGLYGPHIKDILGGKISSETTA